MAITLNFSEPMAVPADGSGVSLTDDAGNTFTTVSVAQGLTTAALVYTGSWAPADPVPGVDVVSVNYTESLGDLISVAGYPLGDFSGVAIQCGIATSLIATTFDDVRIDLSWTESPDDPTVTYELFRDTVSIQTFAYGQDAFSDTGLVPSTLYAYRLDTLFGVNPIGDTSASATTDASVIPVDAITDPLNGDYITDPTTGDYITQT